MKGIVFTEFLDMLDSRFGPDTTEASARIRRKR